MRRGNSFPRYAMKEQKILSPKKSSLYVYVQAAF